MKFKKRLIWLGILIIIPCIFYLAYSAWLYGNKLKAQKTVPYNPELWGQVSFIDQIKPEDIVLLAGQLQTENSDKMTKANSKYPYDTYEWERSDQAVSGSFVVKKTGGYLIKIDYLPEINLYEKIFLDIEVDGVVIKNGESVILPAMFALERPEFETDARGNQIYPEQMILDIFSSCTLKNGIGTNDSGYLVLSLEAGPHTIRLIKKEGALRLGRISLAEDTPLVDYKTYKDGLGDRINSPGQRLLLLEAEQFYYKNDRDISVTSKNKYLVSPYRTNKIMLNAIDEESFKNSGQRLAYLVSVGEEGFYYVGIKGQMPKKANSPVFMDIEIDRKIPFKEFRSVVIDYKWSVGNHLSSYPVFLDKGVHEIALTLNGDNYLAIASELEAISNGISDLSMDIKKLTGNSRDQKREWDLAEYLPNLVRDMNGWKDGFNTAIEKLKKLSGGKTTEEIQNLTIAGNQLERLISEPNRIPAAMAVLSEGSGSVLQMLTQALLTIKNQNISLDQIILTTDTGLVPVAKPTLPYSIYEGARRFVSSFFNAGEETFVSGDRYVDIWVRSSRQYMNVIRTLIDEDFTGEYGIKVRLSLINDQGKLTLANAAGKQPDGVLGVDSYYINDLAVRGSLADLKQFDGIETVVGDMAPGSLLQMIIDDKLYGLPQTQDFYVLFYRKDIFESFGFKIPETWEDVQLMLPSLQRNGMNFFTTLSEDSAFKSWPATMPFYAQFGADIYAPDGSKTIIDSDQGIKAMKYMTDLYKIYGLPLQVKSFYNSFRFGTTPIGIGNFSKYIELKNGAPELENRWGLALMPGIRDGNGKIQRWCTGGSSAIAIFEESNKKEDAWTFMEWWLSEKTQTEYTSRLQNIYGREYLWNSGNLKALDKMPIPDEDKKIIMEQVKWVKEAPKIPGGYFTEREISDAWNRIIFDGADVRTAAGDAAINTNREIQRKLEEFGYMKNGELVREYIVPTIEEVEGWLENGQN